ncbi:MAG: helix-turn-helix transcriptional regulator [Oscillospiraceae bacterium]|nr:helix-turn-helix transcriptional regulator [Oscillospiraceae bacterium]
MLYQKLLINKNSYLIYVTEARNFQIHRHPEIELSFCLEGSYTIGVGNTRHRLQKGDLAVINSMVAHEAFQNESQVGRRLTIEFGPSFLKEHFSAVANLDFDIAVYHLQQADPLLPLLEEVAKLHQNPGNFSDLVLKGNLYHISARILQELLSCHTPDAAKQGVQEVTKIEQALGFIYDHYAESPDLDRVSQLCGYSKSHFCRVFKNITGDTFHNVLNRHRIEIACLYLKESNTSVESVALQVGFPDAKSFCRVFKKQTGTTPNQYRHAN